MMKFVDTHAHLTCPKCSEQADALVMQASSAGVGVIINICMDGKALEEGLALSKRYPSVYNVGSTTPHDVEDEGEEAFEIFARHARAGDLIGIGETGLDYFHNRAPHALQQHYLRRYLALAQECSLPLVFHCREAFTDLLRISDEEGGCRAILHCFTGTLEEAQEVLKRGWYISISGIITYPKSEELRAIVKKIPLERLVLETDTPYLAPQKKRSAANQPAYLIETAQLVAGIKKIPLQHLAQVTTNNASSLFNRQF